jgi:aerobic carbon-monoxide dehydrogenase medium subunit
VRPRFDYHRPVSVEEACALLAREPQAAVLAGGTDLMVHLGQSWRGRRPPALINVKRIPGLAAIDVRDDRIRVGALTTLTDLIEHPVIREELPVLPFTARYMGSPAIRNLATVGGNLCNGSPAADLPPVLLALDAEVGVAGAAGERRLALADFFRGPGQTALATGELLLWLEVPRRRPPWPIRYERLDVRRAMDIAIAGAALAIRPEADRVREARVALCAVAPIPIRVPAAEEALVEHGLTADGIARAAERCMAAARPISDVRASAEYRREMVGALVRRGLEALGGG